jgi:Ca2+-binding RTX toxin-like protein
MLDGGLAGNDTLTGGAGSDTLFGGDGADQLNGGEDSDFLSGAAGDDTINGDGGYDTLILSGNRSDYVISVSGGGRYSVTDLRANGDGVDDISQIESIAFADVTVGLWTFVGSIDVMGTSGDDVFSPGTAARERFFGLAGNDSISGGQEEDDFIGGAGNDTLHGGGPTDPENQDDLNFVWDILNYAREYRIAIDEGIVAQGVTVDLATGQATDTYGDTDTLFEIERVFGTPLADRIDGSDADEAFDPHGGADTINGGAGWDNLNYHLTDGYHGGGTLGITVEFSASVAGSGTVIDPLGNTDEFSGIEVVRGTRFDDVFVGGAGEQQFRGFRGDDRFDGGAGFTTVTYHDDANYGGDRGISFDLSVVDALGFATVTDGFLDTDLLRGINRIRGTGGADSMSGDGADNQFIGDAGNDVLSGAGGADILQAGFGDDTLAGGAQDDRLDGGVGLDQLNGGTGSDTLMGGFDADRFLFAAGDGDDVIEDFAVGTDQLVLLGGITIATLVESDVNGDGGIDTTVNLSSGDSIVLLHVEDVTDPSDLL